MNVPRQRLGTRAALAGLVAIGSFTLGTPAPAITATPDPQAELRLATIGYRISAAAASLCAAPRPLTGLLLHDLGQYDAADRDRITHDFGLRNGIGVRDVVGGSAGERAGLQAGDEIVAVAGIAVASALPALPPRVGDYRRMAAFEGLVAAAARAGPLVATIRRAGREHEVVLVADRGCGGEVVLTPSVALNAWSDGTYVAVTTRTAAFAASDDELAFVVAHEMAHVILDQAAPATRGLFASLSAGGARGREADADRFAIRLMTAAGYQATGATSFLKRSGRVRWMDLPLTHPGIASRLRTVATAAENIGRPLD